MNEDEMEGKCSNCGEDWPFDGDCDACEEEEEEFQRRSLDNIRDDD